MSGKFRSIKSPVRDSALCREDPGIARSDIGTVVTKTEAPVVILPNHKGERMKPALRLLSLASVLLAISCSETPPLGPEAGNDLTIDAMRWHGLKTPPLKVFSRNLYIGFDVDETIAALATGDPAVIQAAIATAVSTIVATDFPARAGAVAREIDQLRPDVVGLVEVYDMQVDIPGLPPIDLPFLEILQAKLAERGLNYVEAARVTDTDAQLPGISLVDHDVILVNPDRVVVDESDGQLFSYNLGDPFSIGISIVRGWTRIKATISGETFEVWNTHLESGADPQIVGLRALQAGELASLASTDMPVVVIGDLNDEPGSPMYGVMTGAQFDNVWETLRGESKGYTCCHAADLSNVQRLLYHRIDHVFVRGLRTDMSSIWLTGFRASERVPGPYYKLWPSDHAGVFAAIPVDR